jgi:hypothetical protein
MSILEQAPLKSPCILVCQLDENNVCKGCFRTGEEISMWMFYTDEQRDEILEKLKERFQKAGGVDKIQERGNI